MMSSASEFHRIEQVLCAYPCVKMFPMPEGTVVYDSKANFATLFSTGSLDFLKAFMLANASREGRLALKPENPALYSLLEKLLDRGVFLPGPMKNIYMTGDKDLREAVDYYEKNILIRKFSLEVTRRCNLRCKYCPYTSGDGARSHEELDLPEGAALSGLDFYFSNYARLFSDLQPNEKDKALKKASPGFGWYGGEPFLNFSLMERSMDYFLSKPWNSLGIERKDFHFAVTTNFTMVSDKIFDFLAQHDVACTVSLDGPKTENDKNRVFAEGVSSVYETVVCNLKRLTERHPEYAYKSISFSSVYAPGHEYSKCERFFSEFSERTHVPLKFQRYQPREMSQHGQAIPDPETKLKQVDMDLSRKGEYRNPFIGKSKEDILEMTRKDSLLASDLEGWRGYLSIAVDNPSGSDTWNAQLNCPIGFDALMLGADGKFYPCERTDQSLPIGCLSSGRDKELIVAAYKKLNALFDNDGCKSCWAIHSCKVCIAQLLRKGKMQLLTAVECEYVRKSSELEMGRFFKCSAETPALVDAVERHEEQTSGICDLRIIREESRNELGKTGILNSYG